jgi:hypothetical protein
MYGTPLISLIHDVGNLHGSQLVRLAHRLAGGLAVGHRELLDVGDQNLVRNFLHGVQTKNFVALLVVKN